MTSIDRNGILKLARALWLQKKLAHYPELSAGIRKMLVSQMKQQEVSSEEELTSFASEIAGDEIHSDALEEIRDALIDYLTVENFSDREIENYINLARKNRTFALLSRTVRQEGVTSIAIKKELRSFCNIPEGDMHIPSSVAEDVRVALIDHFISNQLPFIGVAKPHITVRDVDEIVEHSLWNRRRSGRIGGKAAGLMLAHRIVLPRFGDRDEQIEKYVEIPESFYLNSGIFCDFMDANDLHLLRGQKYRNQEELADQHRNACEMIDAASFPADVCDDFRALLERIGEEPIILRSSTLLEDNFGFAFSGKYDSVFLANQGSLEERFDSFVAGLKTVYKSLYAEDPIAYRRVNQLLDFDERMAVLVQKVVGRRFGDYFFPFAAGVAYSWNLFRWSPRIRKEEGLLRMVFGLGTRAVNRVSADYPRMVPLSHPQLRPEVDASQIWKYSQKWVDVINLKTSEVETLDYRVAIEKTNHPDLHLAVALREGDHLAAPHHSAMKIDQHKACITFDNLLKRPPLVEVMRKILRKLEEEYGVPVDVEFALDGDKLYLLQCRPLSVRISLADISIPPDISQEDTLFTNRSIMTNAAVTDIEYVIYVDPRAYSRIKTLEEKIAVGRAVGKLNRMLEKKRFALIGPGRWGSNDINLGVRVGYQDINHSLVLGEVAFEEDGSRTEVSYGTHFFNDLLEAQIVPVAIYPGNEGAVFAEERLLAFPNDLSRFAPQLAPVEGIVRLLNLPEATGGKRLTVLQDEQRQQGIGYLYK